jgi:hypothetical protein
MMFRVPDWLSYEVGHKLERLGDGFERLGVKEKINDHPRTVAIIALLFVLLLAGVLSRIVRGTGGPQFRESKKAWFYDLNTGELFSASSKHVGPIEAPSGPLPNGEPAGYRAHVYSFLRDPNESERFIAFLEKPDPNANVEALNPDRSDFKEWARGRLIRRVGGETWVAPTSRRGRQMVQQVTHPNAYGKIPIYQSPK